ncbi:predicted protein [Sclerotinia sclerotiorum 1980 UF-70]|uniref:Uncharacterized protein n=1 Tax=Sclerotinia sclerotiorum (strain ATCC 18683 / 1980 / Ss-1) TaxID=665079 RepID=A7ETC9_SCLS1|nr:predicted protein [Sclerotinia sclerotiorum 1980 UF-70]EDN92721.1 predicted protein [Sclerotinia sclerotiorum 1980 UF-70]
MAKKVGQRRSQIIRSCTWNKMTELGADAFCLRDIMKAVLAK